MKFEDRTPIVNNQFLADVKSGAVNYRRGDTLSITAQGVKFNERKRGTQPGEKGEEGVITGDVICLATGFEKPSVEIFPKDLFPTEGSRHYQVRPRSLSRDVSLTRFQNDQRPNLYLQNFSTEDWSILLTNSAYKNSIGSVGNWHIGIYARILIVFLLDEKARPTPAQMKLWVDLIGYLKGGLFGEIGERAEGLDFFTYSELCVWVVYVLFLLPVAPPSFECHPFLLPRSIQTAMSKTDFRLIDRTFHAFRISRLKWLPFVLFGWGLAPPTAKSQRKF